GVDGAPGGVGAGEVAGAEEEGAGDLAAGEDERFLEQAHPRVFVAGVVGVEPVREGAVRPAQGEDAFGVFDGGVDFEAVADDAGVLQQARAAAGVIAGDALDGEVVEGFAEGGAFAEDRQPRQARLVDLEDEALEQAVVIAHGESVLGVVIRPVVRMPRRDVAVRAQFGCALRFAPRYVESLVTLSVSVAYAPIRPFVTSTYTIAAAGAVMPRAAKMSLICVPPAVGSVIVNWSSSFPWSSTM